MLISRVLLPLAFHDRSTEPDGHCSPPITRARRSESGLSRELHISDEPKLDSRVGVAWNQQIIIQSAGDIRYADSADNIVEENSSVFSLIRMRWLPLARHAGSKTLHQQNPPVLNWKCWLMQTGLHTGCKMVVVVVYQQHLFNILFFRTAWICPHQKVNAYCTVLKQEMIGCNKMMENRGALWKKICELQQCVETIMETLAWCWHYCFTILFS